MVSGRLNELGNMVRILVLRRRDDLIKWPNIRQVNELRRFCVSGKLLIPMGIYRKNKFSVWWFTCFSCMSTIREMKYRYSLLERFPKGDS